MTNLDTTRNNVRYEIICLRCNKSFIAARKDAKTCSQACRKAYTRNQNKSKIYKFFRTPKPGYVYAVAGNTGPVKLGRCSNINTRLSDIRQQSGISDARFLAVSYVTDMIVEEMRLHGEFCDRHLGCEWFDINHEEAIKAIERIKSLNE